MSLGLIWGLCKGDTALQEPGREPAFNNTLPVNFWGLFN